MRGGLQAEVNGMRMHVILIMTWEKLGISIKIVSLSKFPAGRGRKTGLSFLIKMALDLSVRSRNFYVLKVISGAPRAPEARVDVAP